MKPLSHNYPQWEHDRDRGEDVLAWGGHMRIVRNRKRARRLKRRGVPLMHLGYGDGTAAQQVRSPKGNLVGFGPWAWFETFEGRAARMQVRHERAQARFAKRNPPPTFTQEQIEAGCRMAIANYLRATS